MGDDWARALTELDAGLRGIPLTDPSILIDELRDGGARGAASVVRRYVGHQDPGVRISALAFLEQYGGREDGDALLLRLFREPSEEIAEHVIDALAALRCRRARSTLRALSRSRTRPPHLRRAALDAYHELAS